VSTVMSIRFTERTRNFLTSWVILSF
jgi:hypothetical protein